MRELESVGRKEHKTKAPFLNCNNLAIYLLMYKYKQRCVV